MSSGNRQTIRRRTAPTTVLAVAARVDADGDGAGDHVQPITTPNANEYDQKPEYSHSGKEIVFFRSQEAGGKGPGDLWKLLIQDGTIMDLLLNLTQTNSQHEHGATWKRNGVCVTTGR